SDHHCADQRDRFSVSPSQTAAVTHSWDFIAGGAGGSAVCAVLTEPDRRGGGDGCHCFANRAVLQCVCADRAVVPESTNAEGAGANAVGAAFCGGASCVPAAFR